MIAIIQAVAFAVLAATVLLPRWSSYDARPLKGAVVTDDWLHSKGYQDGLAAGHAQADHDRDAKLRKLALDMAIRGPESEPERIRLTAEEYLTFMTDWRQ